MILGIDEVGRGPWAGPLVIGAVVLGGEPIDGLTDSKKLTKKKRDELDKEIREKAAAWSLGWVSAEEIDTVGLSESLRLATRRAVEQIKAPYHEIIIDGTINFLAETAKGPYVTTLKKADLLIPSVSAASIIAKVARDTYMAEQDKVYEGYRFASHVGYGTAIHRAAIEAHGVTPLHRLSFAPLQKYRDDKTQFPIDKKPLLTKKLTTKAVGDSAEDAAANYLVRNGHRIVERNWKTRYCEIDIVSEKNDTFYFTEVKYRKQQNQGGGIAAITKKKRHQMDYAARFYAQSQKLVKRDLRLSVITATGANPEVVDWLHLES
jgi:ribonuclease HII